MDRHVHHCFQYFPGHPQWSSGLMFGSELQTWGAAALGEIDQIGQRLRGRESDNDAWFVEWRAMAERMEKTADEHAGAGRELTAGTYYMHASKITCPFLVVHGANDSIMPVEEARRTYAAVSSKVKTLKIFTTEEGGSEHCQGDNRQLSANFIADWVAENL